MSARLNLAGEEENVERWRQLFRRLFDPSPAHAVMLDLSGVILETNFAWRRFAQENGMPAAYRFIGKNYLEPYESQIHKDNPMERKAYVGLQEVLQTQRSKFTMVYPCQSPVETRWFRMWVEPQLPAVPVIVVAHYQIEPPVHPDIKKITKDLSIPSRQKLLH